MKTTTTRWIAELGSNHNGSLERAVALVEAAAESGFTDVKTQAWRVEEMFSPEALEARPELRERQALAVPPSWHPTLRRRAHELGMKYGVTVCSVRDLEEVFPHADWLKTGSYELLNLPLIEAVSRVWKPVVMSTGMATMEEVEAAVAAHAKHRTNAWPRALTLLHAVSAYPAPAHEANLRSIPYLKERFGVDVGWSDHTLSRLVLDRAVRVHGASVVELHFDLDDRKGAEATHSWTPEMYRWRGQTDHTDEGYYAVDGKKGRKAPTMSEEAEREWRADPSDGMRPLLATRERLKGSTNAECIALTETLDGR